jgi:hypothetical protein
MRKLHSVLVLGLLGAAISTACGSDDETTSPVPVASAGGSAGAAGASGAGGSGTGGATSNGKAAGTTDAVARFDLAASGAPVFLDVPFPSDAYLDADGTLVDVIPGLGDDGSAPDGRYLVPYGSAHLNFGLSEMNGFGVNGGCLFRIDDATKKDDEGRLVTAEIDPATLPADGDIASGASAMLLDLEATDGASARVPARVRAFKPNKGSDTPGVIVIYPARGLVLKEGHRYAAIVTSGVKAANGAPLGASATFAAIANGERDTPTKKLYGDAIDKAIALMPELSGTIANIAPYTTMNQSPELFAMRTALEAAGPAALSFAPPDLAPVHAALFAAGSDADLPTGWTATLDAWLGQPDKLPDGTDDPATDQGNGYAHDALAAVGHAVFDAPNFLRENAAMGYEDPQHHTVYRDAAGKPAINPDRPTNKVWLTITLPNSAMPADGFPVVMMEHGLGGDRATVLELGNTFARKGWATVTVEAMTHGTRAPVAKYTKDETAFPTRRGEKDSSGTLLKKWGPAGMYDGPDGFVDSPNGATDFFGMLLSIGAIRDQIRQSVLDYCSTAEVLRNPALDLGPLKVKVPGAKLDGSRVAYAGISLSGILGSMVAAIDPHVKAFVLDVPGGGFITELATESPTISQLLATAVSFNFGFTKDAPVPPFHPGAHLLQHIVDPGDPLTFAHYIVKAPGTVGTAVNPKKSVLQIEVLWDQLVSNQSNEALAAAAGFGLAEPSTGPIAGVSLVSVQPKDGVISDYPESGITAVMVQSSPAVHGNNMVSRHGTRTFSHPYGKWETDDPFSSLPSAISVAQPYLETQSATVEFIGGSFDGKTPPVKWSPPPVRDFDGDGKADDADAAPEDPAN